MTTSRSAVEIPKSVRHILDEEAEIAESEAQACRKEIEGLQQEIADYTSRAEELDQWAAECRTALERINQP